MDPCGRTCFLWRATQSCHRSFSTGQMVFGGFSEDKAGFVSRKDRKKELLAPQWLSVANVDIWLPQREGMGGLSQDVDSARKRRMEYIGFHQIFTGVKTAWKLQRAILISKRELRSESLDNVGMLSKSTQNAVCSKTPNPHISNRYMQSTPQSE